MNRNLKIADLGARIIIVTNARNLTNQLNAIAERATLGRVPNFSTTDGYALRLSQEFSK